MKKFYLIILPLILLFFSFNVYASTNTEERTENDLKIHDDIKVNSSNIDNILNTPKVNENEKIYDFADLFTDNEEETIYERIMAYITLTNYDMAVVTIDDNNKKDEKEYADDFYDYNYFGFDSSYSGVLILIDMDNRGVYISTSGYAIKMYDDYRINNIIDYGWNHLVNGKYSACILQMITRISYYYNLGHPSSNDDLVIDGTDAYYDDSYKFNVMIPIIGAGVVTLIISLILYFKTNLKIKGNNTVSYLVSENNVNINKQFLRSAVTKVPRNTDSGSSGSRSGGSSISRGSSGRSHGGGGRRF